MKQHNAGFSLVELLVVTVLMGLVVTAMYGLYLSSQKNAFTSEEVVDVQQNMRIALEDMARDLRMAGFLLPLSIDKFVAAPSMSLDENNDQDCQSENTAEGGIGCFAFRTVSTTGSIGRLAGGPTPDGSDPTTYHFPLGQPDMIDFFEGPANDVSHRWARIVRPGTGEMPLAQFFRVDNATSKGTADLVLKGFATPTSYYAGDVVLPYIDADSDGDNNIATPAPGPSLIQTVSYRLVDDPDSADPAMHLLVRRTTNDGDQTMAAKITDLRFSYILGNGTTLNAVSDATQLSDIQAVRITLSGSTDASQTGRENYSGVKNRTFQTLVKIRN